MRESSKREREKMGKGGTEAFPDLGKHCDQEDCKMLDFLPFTCDGCDKVFCVEHRTYMSHSCPKAYQNSRTVVVCDVCSVSIEKKAGEKDTVILEQHKSSKKCDPAKKNKAKCPMKRCKELLTFSNTSTCKICNIKICLKHRFPSDHDCKQNREKGSKFPVSFPARSGTSCSSGNKARMPSPSPIKAC